MDAITHAVNFPAPAGYEASFAMPGEAATAQPRTVQAAPAPTAAPDVNTAAATVLTAVKRVDYVPIGVGELASMLMVGLVWRHLKGGPARMRAIAADEAPKRASWLRDDDHAERIAFEARYGRGNRR